MAPQLITYGTQTLSIENWAERLELPSNRLLELVRGKSDAEATQIVQGYFASPPDDYQGRDWSGASDLWDLEETV
jgi:hypothetical protein